MALVLSKVQALGLRIRTTVEPAERPAYLRAFVAKNPLDLYDGDRAIRDPAEQQRVLARSIDDVVAKKLPELLALGIVEA
jgi:hypothetical protein